LCVEILVGIHEVKLAMNMKNFNLNRSQPYDPITPVARDIGRDTTLLCFDEFQVQICNHLHCAAVTCLCKIWNWNYCCVLYSNVNIMLNFAVI